MQRVFAEGSVVEAQRIAELLLEHGIGAKVLSSAVESQGSAAACPAFSEVWVDDRDADRGRELVETREEHITTDVVGRLRCSHCQAENPSSFEACWGCGKTL
jgi:hypothetical protein